LRSATPPVTGGHGQGSIDALSYGFGTGDPIPSDTQFGTGTLTGGNLPTPLVFTRQFRTWGPVPSIPRTRRIDLAARNVAAVTINVRRANVGCSVDLHVDTDGPMTIELAGCGRTVAAVGREAGLHHRSSVLGAVRPRLELPDLELRPRCGATPARRATQNQDDGDERSEGLPHSFSFWMKMPLSTRAKKSR